MNSEEKAEIQFLPVEEIHFMNDNPNVMPGERYDALLAGMKAAGPVQGPYKIDPIQCWRNDKGEVIVWNGNHRLKAAKDLKWPQIRAVVDPSIKSELDSRIVSHNKNFERGDVEPWAQAKLVGDMAKDGKTKKAIAAQLHVSEDTVRKRLTLLKVDPEVRKQLSVMPDFGISHFELVGALDKEEQQEAAPLILKHAKSYYEDTYRVPSLAAMEEILDEAKRNVATERKFQNSLAMFPDHVKCPKCGLPAIRESDNQVSWSRETRWTSAGAEGLPWVQDAKHHDWNLKTGKLSRSWRNTIEEQDDGERSSAKGVKKLPAYVRTVHTLQQYQRLFSNIGVSHLPSIRAIEKIDVRGVDKDGNHFAMDMDLDRDGSLHFRVEIDRPDTQNSKSYYSHGETISEVHYSIEAVKYKAPHLQHFHTVIRTGEVTPKEAEKVLEDISKLFEQFGKK